MKRELALDITRLTEAAALACINWIGKGDKNQADDAAVNAMRKMFEKIAIDGTIVIGEGEIDEAPMLYIGEKVGCGGCEVEIAVDPIDGTRMVALGQDNAVSVIVVAEKDVLLKAPDMYMEKLMVNRHAKNCIDIDLPILENVKRVSKVLNKSMDEMTVMTLAKPRHEKVIRELQDNGVKVIAIPDGDVAGSIKVAMPNENIDMFYGIGGAPEGVISAAIMQCLDGDMQAKLVLRKDCKNDENVDEHSRIEQERCDKMGIKTGTKLTLEQLCKNSNVIMSITGITDGTLLQGVKRFGEVATSQTIMIRGKSKTIRKISSEHFL